MCLFVLGISTFLKCQFISLPLYPLYFRTFHIDTISLSYKEDANFICDVGQKQSPEEQILSFESLLFLTKKIISYEIKYYPIFLCVTHLIISAFQKNSSSAHIFWSSNYIVKKCPKKKGSQNSVDDTGFVHLLLQPYQSCDGNTEQTARRVAWGLEKQSPTTRKRNKK